MNEKEKPVGAGDNAHISSDEGGYKNPGGTKTEMKRLICIECPRGCEMNAFIENEEVKNVEGNFCVKGEIYAKNELIRPLRVVTTTVRLKSGEMLPVKTDKGVLKNKVIEITAKISRLSLSKPIQTGQIIAEDIDGEGTKVIAARSII